MHRLCILPADDNLHQIEMEQFHTLAMAVDTSFVFHTFKLILGGSKTKTNLLDLDMYRRTNHLLY